MREPDIEPFVEIDGAHLVDKSNVAEAKPTKAQIAKDVTIYILKNPKTLLEWVLFFLVLRMLLSGEFNFEIMKKFLK